MSVPVTVKYLGDLQSRMDAIGFAPTDKLRTVVGKAYDAVYTLSVTIHYAAVEARRKQSP
jgi:hypothetical protein